MTTLAVMKARIASEMARDDLTSDIASAITTAIEAYQHERFYLTESRDNTLTTVASQRIYTSSDAPWIGEILGIDFLKLEISSTDVRELERISQGEMEDQAGNTTATGQPDQYSIYDEALHLYPIPSQAFTVRHYGTVLRAAPETDEEADNIWMTDAERLIRSRAKYELSVHVTSNGDMAIAMSPDPPSPGTRGGHETYREFMRLKARSAGALGSGSIKPYD